MFNKLLSNVVTPIAKFIDNVKIYKRPMFIDINYKSYKCVSNEIYYEVKPILEKLNKPCIIGRYYDEYISSYLINNKQISHVGLFTNMDIDGKQDTVIHAGGQGIISESILKFLSCDKFYIIEIDLPKDELTLMVTRALEHVGKKYDFVFDKNNDNYYCSELIYKITEGLHDKLGLKLKSKTKFGIKRQVIEPIDILENSITKNHALRLVYSYPKIESI